MSPGQTAKALTEDAQAWTCAELATTVRDTPHSLAEIATACGKSATIAEDWQGGSRHLPVYVLANLRVPRAVRARIIGA